MQKRRNSSANALELHLFGIKPFIPYLTVESITCLHIWFNSLVPGWCDGYFKKVVFKHMLWIKFMSTSCEIKMAPIWILQNTFDDESTLAQSMAWCHQETKPVPEPMLTQTLGITRPQWVTLSPTLAYIVVIHYISSSIHPLPFDVQ